jgi:methylthioribose-1-phosphate isomerase
MRDAMTDPLTSLIANTMANPVTTLLSPPILSPLMLLADKAVLLDQTRLPLATVFMDITSPEAMASAIQTMVVRGAPAIGLAAAFGVVLSARQHVKTQPALSLDDLKSAILQDSELLRQTRPTAVNLMWALDRMNPLVRAAQDTHTLISDLEAMAHSLHQQDIAINQAIGHHGAALLPTGASVLTHCNAGALATGGYGTALGVIRAKFEQDPTLTVYADETRPRLQGAKLTVWELQQSGIPVTLLTDGMSGHVMQQGKIAAVIVGADRIAANGDTANKIGTYNLAIVARYHNVPFYVAAPRSTFDTTLATGQGIPIETREADEIRLGGGNQLITPANTTVYNPGFDVTPAELITGIITEDGVFTPPYNFIE